jgi:hypothetical protein
LHFPADIKSPAGLCVNDAYANGSLLGEQKLNSIILTDLYHLICKLDCKHGLLGRQDSAAKNKPASIVIIEVIPQLNEKKH